MSIYEKLYSWQKKIVDKYKKRDAYGLFLDCGLGKTPLGLAFAEQNQCTKIIIITINGKAIEDENISGSWFNWAKQSSINYKLNNKSEENFNVDNNDILLINYESLFKRGRKNLRSPKLELKENIKSFIESCKNHKVAILIDESHKVKDLKSLQTQAIIKIQTTLKLKAYKVYTYLLTGTPFTQGYIDLYTQLKILGCDMTKTNFIDYFCIRGQLPGLLGWQQPIVGYKNLNSLYELIHQYAITMKSSDVVELPEQTFIEHTLPMSRDFLMLIQEKAKGTDIIKYADYKNIEMDKEIYNVDKRINNPFYRNIDYPDEKYLAETSGSFWLRARQLTIGFQGNAEECIWYDKRRLNELRKFLEHNEGNYLLFYNYTPELLEIYPICEELGYNIDVYCGECKSLNFYEKYASQKEEEKITNNKNIILANFASGSTGMNWQLYNQCIIFSTPVYKDWEQGLKRVHRLGQKHNVVYHRFTQNNWLDKAMIKSLNENGEYNSSMFDSDLKKFQMLKED